MTRAQLNALAAALALIGGLLVVIVGAWLLAHKKISDGEFAAWALLAREVLGWGVNVIRHLFPSQNGAEQPSQVQG